jgi:TPR repeat protein
MSFLTKAPVAALFMFALLSTARAQAPVQTSTQATARPPDNDSYSVRESAAAGDAQAQFTLGKYYFSGVGVPQDYGQALLWFTKSANQDFAPAQNQLGYMYQHKFGVPRDYKRAVAYYRSAAKHDYALAQYNMGGMFEDGVESSAITNRPLIGTAKRRTKICRRRKSKSVTSTSADME